jgi:hypothetical protein
VKRLRAAPRAGARSSSETTAPFVLRSRRQVTARLDEFPLIPPGPVHAGLWQRATRRKGTAPIVAGAGVREAEWADRTVRGRIAFLRAVVHLPPQRRPPARPAGPGAHRRDPARGHLDARGGAVSADNLAGRSTTEALASDPQIAGEQ